MLKAFPSYLLLTLVVIITLFSCVPQKGVTNAKKELATINNQLQQHSTTLKDLEKQRKKKEQPLEQIFFSY